MSSTDDVDVIVIGGGPAGAATAGLLAMRGHDVLVLERERFPRYHIGESLITGVLPAIEELGIYEQLDKMGFTKKYGGTLLWGTGTTPAPGWRSLSPDGTGPGRATWGFRFREASRYEYSYQVRRADFDALLLGRARQLGATVIEEATVKGPVHDGDRVTGVTYTRKGEPETRSASAKLVIDASGQQHLLGRTLDLINYHDDLRNIAIWSYHQGCGRYEGERAGDILTEARPNGWFWFIPLHDGTVSIGYVTQVDELQRSGKSLEELYESEMAASEEVRALTRNARRVTAYRTIKDWSYTCKRFAGPGWVLVGDAAAFIDPLLSTGVTLAMRGAHGLSRTVDAVLRDPASEERLLAAYEDDYRRFLDSLLDFVRFFYERDRPKEDYWDRAQAAVDPERKSSSKVSFATMLSGLTGLGDMFTAPAGDRDEATGT